MNTIIIEELFRQNSTYGLFNVFLKLVYWSPEKSRFFSGFDQKGRKIAERSGQLHEKIV
jgi:hypothetical protein